MTATLPRASYLDAESFQRERRTIFARSWQMIALKRALKAPGDYVCQNLAGTGLFVLSDAEGRIGAFLNACRHQSLPLLDAGAGKLPFSLLRCRYHGWAYNLDGSFNEAPLKYSPQDRRLPEHGLRSLPLREWRGLLLVSPEGSEADVEAELGAAETELPLAAELMTDFACNWKLLLEHWLADRGAGWRFLFPSLALEPTAGALVVQQVIPRTHERTRLLSHVLTEDAQIATVERTKTALAEDKLRVEALQAALARGEETMAAAEGSALAAFRARVAAAEDRG